LAWNDNVIPSLVNNYARTANANAKPYSGIVVHVTGKQTLADELNWMKTNGQGLGYHYIIDRDGTIYQTAPLDKRMNQVLPDLDKSYNNNNSLGVAMVAGGTPGDEPPAFSSAQLAAGKTLVDGLRNQYNIPANRVAGHGQIQTDREAGNKLNAAGGYEGQDFISYYNKGAPSSDRTASAPTTSSPPSRPGTATPGATLNSPMDLVAQVESGNRNIPQAIHDVNTDRGTPAGGYFQIIDPTWQRYAGAAGVDVKQYPTAMSAPRNIQAQVASAIPVNQWGPNTVAALKAKFPGIDTGQTLGQVQSAVLNGGSGAPGIARGATPATPLIPGTSIAGITPDQSKALMGDLSQLDKSLGGKGLGGAGGTGGGDEPQPAQMGPAPPIHNMSNPAAFAPALWGNTLNSIQTPPQWSAQSPGQNPYANAGGAPIGQQFGTQLGSMQQLQQMMAMMGNPYGDQGYG
jgi:hypothetical protein